MSSRYLTRCERYLGCQVCRKTCLVYIGMRISIGHNKTDALQTVVENVVKRISGWGNSELSCWRQRSVNSVHRKCCPCLCHAMFSSSPKGFLVLLMSSGGVHLNAPDLFCGRCDRQIVHWKLILMSLQLCWLFSDL